MLWGRSRLRPGVAVAACAVAASVLSSGAQGATIDIGVVVASPVTLGEGESLDNAGIVDTGAAGIAVVTVPIAPIEAPMIATGFPAQALSPYGLEAQSIAFLSTPGTE